MNSFSQPEGVQNPQALLSGEFVGARYRVIRMLGSGGMGEVYLAEDTKLNRPVAIKSIRMDRCADDSILRRVKRECLLHAKIGAHPHIVALFDLIDENGQLDLIMEYVPGETLEGRLLQKDALLRESDCIDIAVQLLRALAHTHRHGIAHRDIKPGNVMLTEGAPGECASGDGAPGFCAKLMDFGIARLTGGAPDVTTLTRPGGHGPGTPLYMSPEQIDSVKFGGVSCATDIYSMGVLLYQLLAGRPPFEGTLTDVFNAHLNFRARPIVRADGTCVSAGLMGVIDRAMRKQPSDRYGSADAFIAALEGCRDGSAERDLAPAGRYEWRRRRLELGHAVWETHNRKRIAAAAIALPIVLVTILFRDGAPHENGLEIALAVEAAQPSTEFLNGPEPIAAPPVALVANVAAQPETEWLLIESEPEPFSSSEPVAVMPFPIVFDSPVERPRPVETLEPAETPVREPEVGAGSLGPAAVPAGPALQGPSTFAVMPEEGVYTVQSGDTLIRIASRYGLDAHDLARWNRLRNPNALRAGQTVYLFEQPEAEAMEPSYRSEPHEKNGVFRRSKNWFRKITR